jgi:acylphosphatase
VQKIYYSSGPQQRKEAENLELQGIQNATDKEVDAVIEQEQQENLEKLIEQMEKGQQIETDKKGKDNATN